MPGPSDLVVTNQTSSIIIIQGKTVPANGSYTVAFADLSAWATDPYLRISLLSNQVYISVLGNILRYKDAADWMDKMAKSSIVFAS